MKKQETATGKKLIHTSNQSEVISYLFRRDKNYKVKINKLSKLSETSSLNSFERHLLQEGIKQVLFANGTEEYYVRNGDNFFTQRRIPEEMILFLLDHDLIEETL